MTQIIYKTGNALQGPERFLLHGCNAQGVMGSGIAKAVRDTWPEAYCEYLTYCDFYRGDLLGRVCGVRLRGKTILNGITQEFYGKDPGRIYVSYEAVQKVMREVNRRPDVIEAGEVAMPLIGAGLANGCWSRIADIIEQESTRFQPVVYTLDGKIPL